jgi:VanZ family protein
MSPVARGHHPDPRASREGFSEHTVRLAWILGLAYLLIVVYASVQPFQGWRLPPPEIARFLAAPWPRYITSEDIFVNVAAYAPLGFLLSIGCGARYGAGRGVLAATFYAAGLSLAMETVQVFLPSRIASNVDLLTNSVGALIGAMAAPLFAPTHVLGGQLHGVRHGLFREGMAADVGLVIVCLWPLTQFHPTAQLFGTGAVRASFELPAYSTYTPALALGGEAAVTFFNLLGIGLMVSALMRGAERRMLLIGIVTGAALVLKAASTAALHKAGAPLSWLTPGVTIGLLGGWTLLYGATRLPRTIQFALAALCIALATVAINLAPDNPYQSVAARLVASGQSHFLNFSGIVRALSELWPLLALSFLFYGLAERSGRD